MARGSDEQPGRLMKGDGMLLLKGEVKIGGNPGFYLAKKEPANLSNLLLAAIVPQNSKTESIYGNLYLIF